MSRKRKRGRKAPVSAVPLADWFPPESSPSKYCSDLVFSDTEGGTGPLSIVGRELQLVWYKTERNRDRKRKGKVVCVLEFRDCWKSRDRQGDRYCFKTLLLEDLSGAYREWLDDQKHQGRPFGKDMEVLETEIRFSVAEPETMESPVATDTAGIQPFRIHQPDIQDLSNPQVDMLFDVMIFLYHQIPVLKQIEDLQRQHVAELAEQRNEPATVAAANR